MFFLLKIFVDVWFIRKMSNNEKRLATSKTSGNGPMVVRRGVNPVPVPSYWPKPGTGTEVLGYWILVTGYPC
jgi:hypothetical protein